MQLAFGLGAGDVGDVFWGNSQNEFHIGESAPGAPARRNLGRVWQGGGGGSELCQLCCRLSRTHIGQKTGPRRARALPVMAEVRVRGASCARPMDDMTSPPRLPPVSGVLVTLNPAVVRPVAFRAVHRDVVDEDDSSHGSVLNLHEEVPQHRSSGHHSAPLLERHQRVAQCWRTAFQPVHKLCKASFHQSMPGLQCKEGDSRSSSGIRTDSGHGSALLPDEACLPNAIAELEAQLCEKDAEILHLRQTLEQNEQAIIKVYKEKEQVWQSKLEGLQRHCQEQQRLAQVPLADSPRALDGGAWLEDTLASLEEGPLAGSNKLWLDLDSEVAELTTLMEDNSLHHHVRHLRLELHRCRRQLQLAQRKFQDERQCWARERAQILQQQRQLESSYQQVRSHNRQLLRAMSHFSIPLEPLDGWHHSESSC